MLQVDRMGIGALWVLLVSILAVSSGANVGAGHALGAPFSPSTERISSPSHVLAGLPLRTTPVVSADSLALTVTPPQSIGAVNPGDFVLIDSTTESLYSVSSNGIVTVSNALTGANPATHYLFGSDTQRYVTGGGLDPATGELFLSIVTFGPASNPNYIWAVNGLTFAIDVNVTNFHGAVDFAPAGIFYDSGSSRMLVLNYSDYYGTAFVALTLDPTTYQVLYSWNITCGANPCQVALGGVTDVPSQHLFMVTADSNVCYILNVGNFTYEYLPLLGFMQMGPTAYDPSSGAFLFSNLSAPSEVVEARIASFYPFGGSAVNGSFPVNALAAINWDPVDKYFVLTGENVSTGLTELIAVNGTGAVLGSFLEPSPTGSGDARTTTPWVQSGAETILVSSWDNNQTCRIDLASTAPLFRLVQNYSDYPYNTAGMGVDSTLGIVVEATYFPPAVRALSVTTAEPLWTDFLVASLPLVDVAVDPALGTAYVSHGAGGLIEILSTANGTLIGSLTAPHGAGYLLIDPIRAELFVRWTANGSQNQTMFHLSGSSGTLGGSLTATISSVCAFTIDSGADRVWESTCTGVAESFNETSLAYVSTLTAPTVWMYNLASDGQGRLFIEDNSNSTNERFDVFNELTGAWGPNLTLGSLSPGGYAADPAHHLLWVEDGATTVQAFDYLTGGLVGSANLPDEWWWNSWPDSVAWDPTTSTFVAAGGLAGVELVGLVPLPSAPGSLQAMSGNSTAHLSWLAASGSSGYPVLNYSIGQGASASGPWTSIGSSSGLSFNATGLTNGNTYYFEVTARSGSGTSAPSNVATATPATVPYPVPTPVAAASTATSINVTWSMPASDGGSTILDYYLEYATASTGPWTSVTLGVALNDTLKGLSPATTYYLRVAARNEVGTGNYGGIASATTQPGSSNTSSGSGGSSFPLLWIAVIGVVLAAVIVGAVMMLRGKRGRVPPGPSGPPPTSGSAPPGSSTPPPPTPPAGAS